VALFKTRGCFPPPVRYREWLALRNCGRCCASTVWRGTFIRPPQLLISPPLPSKSFSPVVLPSLLGAFFSLPFTKRLNSSVLRQAPFFLVSSPLSYDYENGPLYDASVIPFFSLPVSDPPFSTFRRGVLQFTFFFSLAFPEEYSL